MPPYWAALTPVSAHRAADAMVTELIAQPGMERVGSINPVVGETNDGGLNAIRNRPVTASDVHAALGAIKARTLFIVSPQDQFWPPHYIEADLKAIPNARAVWIESLLRVRRGPGSHLGGRRHVR